MKSSIIILLIAAGLSAMVLSFSHTVVKRNRDYMISTVKNQTMLKTKHEAFLIAEFLNERKKIMATIASWMDPMWIVSPQAFEEEIRVNIEKILRQYPGFDSIHFLNRQGIVAWGVPKGKSLRGVRLFHDVAHPERYRTFFLKTMKRETPLLYPLSITEFNPNAGKLVKTEMLLIIAPVFRNKTYMGSLLAILRISAIGRRFLPPSSNANRGFWGIMDRTGRYLYLNTSLQNLPSFIKGLSRKVNLSRPFYSRILETRQRKREAYLVNWVKIPVGCQDNWRIVRVFPLRSIMSEAHHWLWLMRGLSFFVILIMVLSAVYLIVSIQRSQAKLNALNQKYRDLLDNLQVGAFTFNATTGRIDYINKRACEILGYEPEELIGKDRLFFAWEQERDRIASLSSQRMRGEKNSETYQAHMVHRSGKVIDVEIFASPVRDAKGTVQSVRVMFVDITRQLQMEREIEAHTQHLEKVVQERTRALRESEGLYRSIFETSLAIIYIHQDNKFRIMNRMGMEFFGFKNRQEMLRTNVWDTVPEGERERRRKNAKRRIAGESVPNRYESLVINREGETRVVECNFQRITYQGEPAILAILFDITEKKKLEAEIVNAERLKSMGQLATGVAHDFNNILSAILGRVQLLEQTPDDPNVVLSCAHLVEKAVEEGSTAIKRIQEVTRVRKARWNPEPLPLHQLIEDAIEITRYSWKDQAQKAGKNILIKRDLNDRNLLLPSELREVFINLIINAVDAMPKGGTLRIRTMPAALRKGEEGVKILFEDTGEGIPPAVLKHIFEPFFTTKGSKGTGLGLSIVSEAISRLGGTVNIESRVGEGTRVILEIPWEAGEKAIAAQRTKAGASTLKETKKKGSILVVDDEVALTGIFEDLLRSQKVDVVTANSGEEALSVFIKDPERFSLIFTDLGMPKMNGWELVSRVREISKDIPIVLMTGWGLEISEEEIARAGVSEVISKPLTIKTILETISRYTQS